MNYTYAKENELFVAQKGGCTLKFPMANIFSYFPHMHLRGKRITATVTHGGGSPAMISDHAWDFMDQGQYSLEEALAVAHAILFDSAKTLLGMAASRPQR